MKQLYAHFSALGAASLLALGGVPAHAQMDPRTYVYEDGVAVRVAREIIVRFEPTALKANAVNDVNKQQGYLTEFLTPSALSAVSTAAGFNMAQVATGKVFPTVTMADSTELNRFGEPIPDDKAWAVLLLQLPIGTNEAAVSQLLPRSGVPVIYAHLNPVARPSSVPNDPLYSTQQKSLHYTAAAPNSHINVEGAWAMTTGHNGIKVGVYDSGIKSSHPDLAGVVAGGRNGYDLNSTTPYNDDVHGHGTMVAGIIAAKRNNSGSAVGIAGIAGGDGVAGTPGVQLHSYKMLADNQGGAGASLSSIALAIRNGIADGMNVMNHSWTIDRRAALAHPNTNSQVGLIDDALRRAHAAKVTVVAGSGNTNTGLIYLPAHVRDEWTLTAAGTGADGEWLDESAAVGSNGYSTPNPLVDVAAPGTPSLVYTTTNTGGYAAVGGTSVAAPHVSGLAALLLSYWNVPGAPQDNLAPEDVENILQLSAADKKFDRTTNTFSLTGFDNFTGWGLIDATKALQSVDKSYNAIYRHSVTTTPANAVHVRTEPLVYISGGNRIQPALYDVEVYEITATGPSDYSSSGTRKGRWIRTSATDLRGPLRPYGQQGAAYSLDDENAAVISGTAGKMYVQFKAYAYHLIGKRDIGATTTLPYNLWLPFDPTVAGQTGQISYSTFMTFPQICTGCRSAGNSSGAGVKAYPNPAREKLTLQLPSAETGTATVQLRTSTGRAVRILTAPLRGDGGIDLSLVGLPTGLYFYHVLTPAGVFQGRFTKAE